MTIETVQGYRLSPQQFQVWRSRIDGVPSVVQCVVAIKGELDCRRLLNAIQAVVERHEILRTSFQCLPGMDVPLQVILEKAVVSIVTDDLSELNAAQVEQQFQEICRRDRRQDPKLEEGGLLICSLSKFSTAHYSLVLTLPSICGDIRTLKLLVAEIADRYAETDGITGETIQYADCAEIFNELIAGSDTETGRDYWRKKLAASLPDVKLPWALQWANETANTIRFNQDVVTLQLDAKLADEIAEHAHAHAVSSQSFLLACWQALVARLTGLNRIATSVAFDGRSYDEVERTAGPFAKYLPTSFEVSPSVSLDDLVTKIDAELREMAEWQDYSSALETLPLSFSFDDQSPVYAIDDLTFTITHQYECSHRFELKLACTRTGEALLLSFYYDADIYTHESITRLSAQFQKVVSEALRNSAAAISELEILGDSERLLLLSEFTRTEKSYGEEKCLHTYFEEQAARTPERVALVYDDVQLTYAELNERANQLAHHLRRRGVSTETLVAICLERSVEMLVSVLGVLKAGAGYVPLDPTHPSRRLSSTLSDTQAPVVLTQASLAAVFAGERAQTLCLDADWEAIGGESKENPVVDVETDNLAYVIYTSGSTGQPKGVQVTHRAVNNHMLWMREQVPLVATDRLLQKTSYTFDASIWEFFLPLMCGAQLVLARPGGHQDSAYLVETVAAQRVTILQVVPTMLRALLAEKNITQCTSLRRVFCGGELVTVDLQERFFQLFPQTELYNFYGPTEAAIDVTCWRCEKESEEGFVSIGRALNNVQLYLLDARLKPVPIGVAGELYIGGTSLADGYLNRPELTAERFIPNPFSETAGTRLYRTGDVARYLDDGRLEFLGRKDSQLKLRGFRIELGEIEAVLSQHANVRACAVVAHQEASGEQRLVAYVVAREGQSIESAELRQYLSERLPVYMIPTTFAGLQTLPVLSNGKVDRKALPAPAELGAEREYVAPRTPVEEVLAGIWAEVLKVERISVADNFFDLGGHSLLVTQVISRVRDAFRVQLPLRTFFDAQSLQELAASIEVEMQSGAALQSIPLQPVGRETPLPLSFGQQRLWFLNQMEPESALYNIPTVVRLRGELDVAALQETFTELVRRHESLRTTFTLADGVPVQVASQTSELPLRVFDLSTVAQSEREAEALRLANDESVRPFNLEHGPVMRVLLLKLSGEDHLLVCTTHHIVSDLWSRGVLLREVSQLYAGLTQRQPVSLPELPIQYADHAYWEKQSLQGELLETELGYWKNQLLNAPLFLNLPTDRPRPAVQSLRGAKEGIALPQTLLDDLRALNRREGTTMFMTLLAAFNVLLARYSGQQDLLVGTPVSNRDRVEIEGLVGFFANTLVMRTDTSGNPTFRELLHRVRETSLSAYAHRMLPFEMLVEELQPQRDTGYTPLFQVMFAHQIAPREKFALPGLSLERMDIANQSSKFDLTIFFVERPDSMSAWLEYNTDLFDAPTMQRMLSHLQTLLAAAVANPERTLRELPLLTNAERRELLYERNNTERSLPRIQNVQQLFEDQVARTPERIALVFEDQQLTYAELNERSNQLADYLRELGVGPDRFVGILMSRSVEMMVTVLGVLKAGGAYAALDPNYPKERLAFMLEDTGASVILTQRSLSSRLPDNPARVVVFEEALKQISAMSKQNPPRLATPENLTYVTYTSGSTGKPKGIAMPQRALLNLINWQVNETRLPDGARTMQFASLGFDVSFQDMFSTWATGGTLVMITDEQRRDIAGLAEIITEQNLHRLFIPAVALQQLAEGFCRDKKIDASLLKVIAGSEQLHITPAIARLFTELKDCRLHNEYGPSEAHVVTELALSPDPKEWPERPTVGRPIYNARIYVRDEAMQPTPIGVSGELFIGGPGLARGYLNRPDLTAEKFIPDPFGNTPGGRLYRTGDLARWLANGEIEFLGRMDFQVKIRGFRVEPGEVEVVLSAHAGLKETIVLVREDSPGDKRLVAYIVPRDSASLPNVSELRRFLQDQLPDYMIPSAFVVLEALPLTPNGKVNRKALPAPDQARPELEEEYVPPRGAVEEAIASQWAEALKIERVGREDNFFALGGHSLLAIQVIARLREILRLELPFRVLFESPTVAGLAERLLSAADRPEELEEIAALWNELNGLVEEEAEEILQSSRS